MVWIVEAEYVSDYRVRLTFNDGESGVVDLKDTIFDDPRPIFNELIDIDKFKRFRIAFDTIVWEDGLDLAPEFLYGLLKQALHVT
jgi:hypothetical protein